VSESSEQYNEAQELQELVSEDMRRACEALWKLLESSVHGAG